MGRIRIRRAAILAVAIALAGICAGGAPGAMAQEQPLVIARAFDINSLDPARAWCDTCQTCRQPRNDTASP